MRYRAAAIIGSPMIRLVLLLLLWVPPAIGWAKENADLLVVHGTVVTMDAGRRVLTDGAVAIKGDTIAAVGPTAALEANYSGSKVIDARGDLVMPGLINAHTHMSM